MRKFTYTTLSTGSKTCNTRVSRTVAVCHLKAMLRRSKLSKRGKQLLNFVPTQSISRLSSNQKQGTWNHKQPQSYKASTVCLVTCEVYAVTWSPDSSWMTCWQMGRSNPRLGTGVAGCSCQADKRKHTNKRASKQTKPGRRKKRNERTNENTSHSNYLPKTAPNFSGHTVSVEITWNIMDIDTIYHHIWYYDMTHYDTHSHTHTTNRGGHVEGTHDTKATQAHANLGIRALQDLCKPALAPALAVFICFHLY